MASEQRRLLEQLMGAEIMGTAQKGQMSFKESRVCRSYLCGDCPHDLFAGTKMDLGPCPKIHSDKLKADYEQWRAGRDIGFEFDQLDDLTKHVEECDKRVNQLYQRVEMSPEDLAKQAQMIKQLKEIDEELDALCDEIEAYVAAGAIFEASGVFRQAQLLGEDLREQERKIRSAAAEGPQTGTYAVQKLQVCDVCASLLSKLDNDRRLADHFVGKLHQGYARMRTLKKQLERQLAGKQRPSEYGDDRRRRPDSSRDSYRRQGGGGGGGGGRRRHDRY